MSDLYAVSATYVQVTIRDGNGNIYRNEHMMPSEDDYTVITSLTFNRMLLDAALRRGWEVELR